MKQHQSLAWLSLRQSHNMFVFVDSVISEKHCRGKNDGVWDPEEETCFRLWKYEKPHGESPLDDKLCDKLRAKPYNIDMLEATRNAYRCWVNNDGKMGDADLKADVKNGQVPPCYFAATVVKGKIRKSWHKTNRIRMDGWMGQKDGDGFFLDDGETV